MLKRIIGSSAIAVTAVFLTVSAASAAVFDFQRMADDKTYAHYYGEKGFSALNVTIDGINLKATGKAKNDNDKQQYAYLDAGKAGLGVCKDVNKGLQCAPGSDDNVTRKETLRLAFDTKVIIEAITFRDAHHNIWQADDNGYFKLQIDGDGYKKTPFAAFPDMLMGKVFDFRHWNKRGKDWQFYIDSIGSSPLC